MRRALIVVIVLFLVGSAAWLGAFLMGAGVLMNKTTITQGLSHSVTCNYLRATGIVPVVDYESEPRSVVCPSYIRITGDLISRQREINWAGGIPIDRPVEIECRFFERAAGDGGLGMRFGRNAPLRLRVHFNSQYVEALDLDTALGPSERLLAPAPFPPTHSTVIAVRFDHGTLPIFGPEQHGRLTVMIFAEGRASLMLTHSNGGWFRQGGCRPRT